MPAPKGNKYAKGNKGGGRPSTYNKEMAFTANRLCQLGATDAEVAEYLGISQAQCRAWKHMHEDFNSALKPAGTIADDRVVRSLYQQALGYTLIEKETIVITAGPNKGQTQEITREKVVPPNTAAQIFWLKNRRKTEWRDRHEIEGTVEHKHEHRHVVDPRLVSDEQREFLRQMVLASRQREAIEGEIVSDDEDERK